MWWHDKAVSRLLRLATVLALAAAAGGCFQPVYGERSLTGGPGVRDLLSSIDVGRIDTPMGSRDARLGVEVRNALLFGLTGGGPAPVRTHTLTIDLRSIRTQVIVDTTSTRPDVENYGIDAYYRLTEIETGKVVLTGSTFARVTYDVPGFSQRFARSRGLRDAETRASQIIADNIRSKLTSFFIAGS